MPPKPVVSTNKTISSTVNKPAATTAAKTGTTTTTATKPAVTVNKPAATTTSNTVNKTTTATSAATKPVTTSIQKPAQTGVQKPAVAVNAQKPAVTNTAVKPIGVTANKAPLNSAVKPGVVAKPGVGVNKNVSNQKVDPAAAKKKEEEEKKQQEEKLKEQLRLEEEARIKKEDEEKKQKEEEEKRAEDEKRKKEEEEKKKKEDEERAAIELAEKQYKEAKLAEEKRIKEEQEKLKNGKITIKTNTGGMTTPVIFTIKDGSVSYALVDDELALEFAYEKGYQFFLTAEKDGKPDESISFFSQGAGKNKTFDNLQAGTIYWCVVLKNDAAESKRKAYKVDENAFGGGKSNQQRGEGCSCLYGNPCVDQYVCSDWNNRFTVAKNNLNKK